MELKDKIGITDGFPKEGISFKDVSPLFADGRYLKYTLDKMSEISIRVLFLDLKLEVFSSDLLSLIDLILVL